MRIKLSGPPDKPMLQLSAENAAEESQLNYHYTQLTRHQLKVKTWSNQHSTTASIEFGLQPGVDPKPEVPKEPTVGISVVKELEEDLSVAIKQFQRLVDIIDRGDDTRACGLKAIESIKERYPMMFRRA